MATVIGRSRQKKTQKGYRDMTITEIKNELKRLNIEFNGKAKKEDLLTLLPQKG